MRTALIFLLGLAVVSALPTDPSRIVGGTFTEIEQYPFVVALLRSASGVVYTHNCGGTIINERAVLTAAHCVMDDNEPFQWLSRVGSSAKSSGGQVHNTEAIIIYPEFNRSNLDKDITVIRIVGTFSFGNSVQPGYIAPPNYPIRDNAPVWSVGWGTICNEFCASAEYLKHVMVWIVNKDVCKQRYAERNMEVNENMLCSGRLDLGGRDACQGDSGGPLIHNNNVIIGVTSWGYSCAHPNYPGITARVPVFYNWIMAQS
ncbi:hypothetical protein O0L34_g7570 [Tuta absoluta]|nr:hypothetical protein O0L34_g7570 [Tuta absoluta]